MAESSDHFLGSNGLPPLASIISNLIGSVMPKLVKNFCCSSAPIICAMRAVPMLDDFVITSHTGNLAP